MSMDTSIDIRLIHNVNEIKAIAVSDGRPAGCIEADNYVGLYLGAFWVSRLLVQPAFRGRGLATRMLTTFCEELDRRLASAYLVPNAYGYGSDNDRLIALYERFGFVRKDDENGVFWKRDARVFVKSYDGSVRDRYVRAFEKRAVTASVIAAQQRVKR